MFRGSWLAENPFTIPSHGNTKDVDTFTMILIYRSWSWVINCRFLIRLIFSQYFSLESNVYTSRTNLSWDVEQETFLIFKTYTFGIINIHV